jgi:hypothetical protein
MIVITSTTEAKAFLTTSGYFFVTSLFRPLIDPFSVTILSGVNAVSANYRGLIYYI